MEKLSVVVVGAGILGVTAAWELHQRGHKVSIFDPGPIPHPEASSTDITKMIRMDYGKDDFYFDLMEASFKGWHRWNAAWGEDLYHEDGFLLMKKSEMTDGSFELESFKRLTERGHGPTRMTSDALAASHPMWNAPLYTDGYLNLKAGWAQSGRVVERIANTLREIGVAVHEGETLDYFVERGSRVTGIVTTAGSTYEADIVVLAAGAWTPTLLPYLSDVMWAVGLPVVHFDPANPDDYRPPSFRPWAADISNTGWYGFPLHPTGVVKIANHGAGIPVDPREPKVLPQHMKDRCVDFVAETFPALADRPIVGERLCMYCDTWDGDLWIDHDPNRLGLVVAAGGNGHGFKFAPMLGGIIADVVERKPNRFAERFAWRKRGEGNRVEDARYSG